MTLKNAGPEQVKQWINENFPDGSKPTPNMLNVHNEKVDWEIKTPNLNQSDFSHLIDRMFFQIIAGTGIPSFWLGHHGNTTNATAHEMAQAGLWTIGRIQKTLNNVLTSIISFVVNKAARHNRIIHGERVTVNDNLSFNVVFGKVRGLDLNVAAESLNKSLEFLDKSIDGGYLDEKQARKIYIDIVNSTLDTQLPTDDIDGLLKGREEVGDDEKTLDKELIKAAMSKLNIINNSNGKFLTQG